MRIDQTTDLVRRGYVFTAWARTRDARRGERRDRYGTTVRILGRRATIIGGAAGVRLFYDQSGRRRAGALPAVVARPLFGRGAVHGLDGEQHRHRKAMFVDLLMDESRVGPCIGSPTNSSRRSSGVGARPAAASSIRR
jgi:fatty-acid peroxygenase